MVEVQFPFILIKTRLGLSSMDKVGRMRFFKKIGFISMIIMPFMGAIMIYFLIEGINNMLNYPSVSRAVRELGPRVNILLPGINPYLPLFYGWLALLLGMVIHEFSHGVQAKAHGINVKSTGIVLFLILPIGAFAEVDEKQLEEAELGEASRVLSAGPVSNIIMAFAALAVFILLISSLKPVADGILVLGLTSNGTAYQAGMRYGDIIVGVNEASTPNWNSFVKAFEKAWEQGENITFKVSRNGLANYTFVLSKNLSAMGIVSIVPIKDVLENYSSVLTRSPIEAITIYLVIPTVPFPWVYERIPFSEPLQNHYTSIVFGKDYHYLVNLFFWTWFINFSLGVFNALPLYPLDGGIAFKLFCRKKLNNSMSIKTIDRMVYAVSIILFSLVISTIIIPYIIQ
jgi:membrane-associated protease RseP (regulator of RpoE activity)